MMNVPRLRARNGAHKFALTWCWSEWTGYFCHC